MSVDAVAKALEQFGKIVNQIIGPFTKKLQTKADAESITALALAEVAASELKRRAQYRADFENIRHQQNLETIVEKSKHQLVIHAEQGLIKLPKAGSASDPDWFFKWANLAKESSDEDIRNLWARVLAGEISQPGTFSLRLLNLISLLRKTEALQFSLFCNYVWQFENGVQSQIWNEDSDKYLEEGYGMDYKFYLNLEDLGLINYLAMTGMPVEKGKVAARYRGANYVFYYKGGGSLGSFYTRHLTQLGQELYLLCSPVSDAAYIDVLLKEVRKNEQNCAWRIEKT